MHIRYTISIFLPTLHALLYHVKERRLLVKRNFLKCKFLSFLYAYLLNLVRKILQIILAYNTKKKFIRMRIYLQIQKEKKRS